MMLRFKFMTLATLGLLSAVSFAEELRSAKIREMICKSAISFANNQESPVFKKSLVECKKLAKMDISSQKISAYSGADLVLTLDDKSVLSLKDGDKFVSEMQVAFSLNANICDFQVTRKFPALVNRGGKLTFETFSWNVNIDDCKSNAESELLKAEPGDKNIEVIDSKKIPETVRNQIFSYDLIQYTGHDGYYGLVESSYARVKDKAGKTIGYMLAEAYSYTENPELHYWLFVFDAKGFIVNPPNTPEFTTGDDFLFEGSTKQWLQTGEVDY